MFFRAARGRFGSGIAPMLEENRLHMGMPVQDADEFRSAITAKANNTDRGSH